MKDNINNLDKLLFTATANEFPEFREKLVKLGADINAKNGTYTLLKNALSLYSSEQIENNEISPYVEFLISHGANVNLESPLIIAARGTNFATIKYLIKNGADIHAKDEFGYTGLHVAKTKEIAQFFIEQGLDINSKTNDGYTIAMINPYIIDLDMLKFLINHGLDIHYKAPDNATLLHIYTNNLDVINYLLEQEVDCSLKSNYGDLAINEIVDRSFFRDHEKNQYRKMLMNLLEKTDFKNQLSSK